MQDSIQFIQAAPGLVDAFRGLSLGQTFVMGAVLLGAALRFWG